MVMTHYGVCAEAS